MFKFNRNLNWEEIGEGIVTDLPESDIIIASDVIYGVPLAIMLGKTVAKLLKVKNGKFYGCMQSNRIVSKLNQISFNYDIRELKSLSKRVNNKDL